MQVGHFIEYFYFVKLALVLHIPRQMQRGIGPQEKTENIMAKYDVTCRCGHNQTFSICGPVRTRDERAAWLASQDCPKCRYAAEQAAKAAKVESKPAATKSVILKAAWSQAKAAVKKFGGKAADYIAEAMRYAWGKAKEAVAAGLAIKAW